MKRSREEGVPGARSGLAPR
uniref:Uncharacterized protein n=1 Tax=Arundo donax TaxID=35708 RepID=A0A0A9AI55_ARUDO